MLSSEDENPERSSKTSEEKGNEATLDLAGEPVADDVGRNSPVLESSHSRNGVELGSLTDHGVVPEAPAVKTYSSDEAIERRDETSVRFVDVREAHEVADGVVPGAVHIPLDRVQPAINPDSPNYDAAFDDVAEIVFYCRSGRRSAVAVRQATELGIDHVAHVEGGIRAWAAAGGPVRPIWEPDRP